MKKFIKVITLVLAFSMCLSVAACDFTTVQTLLPKELIELIFNTAERVGGYNSVPQKTFNGEGTIYYNAQKWATEEFLQNNLTYNWLHRTETADLPEFITHIVTEKQAFDEIFPAFPKTIDFDNEVAIVYCFNDNYMGEPYGLKEIKINGEELSISIDRWHVLGTGTMTSPQQRVFVITLQKISFAKVTISFGECLVTEEEMAEEMADELSILELKVVQEDG